MHIEPLEESLILQYRLPFDVPELGQAGDVIVVDAETGAIEVARPLAPAALPALAEVVHRLEPVATTMAADDARALLRGLAPAPARHLTLLLENP